MMCQCLGSVTSELEQQTQEALWILPRQPWENTTGVAMGTVVAVSHLDATLLFRILLIFYLVPIV